MDNSTSSGDKESLGCGSSSAPPPGSTAAAASSSSRPSSSSMIVVAPQQILPITINVQTTTGGNFTVVADPNNSVENLKKTIAKKLKVSKDRISLLFRQR